MDETDQHDLIRRIFVRLTATLENGATLAAEGQGSWALIAEQTSLANKLHALGDEVTLLTDVVIALIEAKGERVASK